MERPERPGSPAEPGGEVEAWRSGRHSPVEASSDQPSHPGPAPDDAPRADPLTALRRFRPRSWKGATGLGIVGAALLLFVFVALDDRARWWLPLAAGFVVLVLLSLLRLDRLLKGWTWHVAGIALLAGLVVETSGNPWAWAAAVSIGVLVAGLLRLPRWQLAAVGAALCVVSFVGYQFRASEVRQQEEQVAQQAGNEMRQALGESRPALVLVKLDRGLRDADADAVCRLLDPQPTAQLLQATGSPSCAAAVALLHGRVPAGTPEPSAPRSSGGQPQPPGTVVTLDGCGSIWGTALPSLGTVDAIRTQAPGETWRVTALRPCASAA
ncbi:hypothetical protein [Pseudonocardia xishanensis]|uniref:Uncharacterized protein n=1 Tax=Pseudonocardia xishanensis TaxID=630995 RepID=A0ABP8RLM0_9PSEU